MKTNSFQMISSSYGGIEYRPRAGHVDINDASNVEKWARVLGISEDELLSSVQEFGTVVTEIRKGRHDKAR